MKIRGILSALNFLLINEYFFEKVYIFHILKTLLSAMKNKLQKFNVREEQEMVGEK